MRKLVLFLVLSLSLGALAGPQGIWGERGISRRFVLRGNLLYAADGRGVSVYDVSNPADIRRIDVESGDIETRDLAFVGDGNLVVATTRGIDRFAVNADGTLQRLGSTDVEGGVTRVAGTATRAVAAAGKTLLILSLDGVGLATEVSQAFPQAIRALATSGTTAYAAVEKTAIYAINTSSGATVTTTAVDAVGLAVSGSTLWAVAEVKGLFAIDLTTGSVAGVTGAGNFKLVDVAAAGSRVYAIEAPNKVQVFDGTTRTAPAHLATLTDWVTVLAASGNRLFVSGSIIDAEGMPFETGVPVRVYDVTGAAAPVKLGELADLAGPISGVWTDGSLAYVVDAPYLRILDISKTLEPRELASVVIPNLQDWIRVRDGKAINYGRVWVHLLDVTKPLEPKMVGSWHTQGHAPSYAAIMRDTVAEANGHSGLHVVDYTNPAEPVQIAGRIFHYYDLTAADDAIYTIQHTIFLTLDITDRRKVVDRTMHSGQYVQLDTLPPNAAAPHHVAVRSARNVEVYSLEQDRFDPRLIGSVAASPTGFMATSDTTIFMEQDGVLHRMPVANPRAFTATDMVVTSPMQISVAGEKVVVADRYRLRVYGPDTAQPPGPPRPSPGRRRSVSH